MTFLHQSRAITLLFINEFSPFAIPNHSSPISLSMQSLKKIGQKLLKLRVRKRSADGRTDGRTDTISNFSEGYNICVWRGIIKLLCAQRRLRSGWAFAQSDQSFRCALNE